MRSIVMGQQAAVKELTKVEIRASQESSANLLFCSAPRSSSKNSAGVVPVTQLPPSPCTSSAPTRRPSAQRGISLLDDQIQALQQQATVMSWEERSLNIFIAVVVMLNAVEIALQTELSSESDRDVHAVWVVCDSVFIVIYLFEILLRARWERRQWFRRCANWFDAALVTCAVVDTWVLLLLRVSAENLHLISVLRIVRITRLVRLVKLVRAFNGLYMMTMAFWHALGSMFWVGCLLGAGIFICAIFTTAVIGKNEDFADVKLNGDSTEERFGTVTRSMYSLFELMTLEGWESVARPIVFKQPLMIIFFVGFMLVFTFGLLNMIVGLVVEKTLEQSKRNEESRAKEERHRMISALARMRELFADGDADRNGVMTAYEFEYLLETNDAMVQCLKDIDIAPRSAKDLFHSLDWDGNGHLTVEEFLSGFAKLQGCVPSSWDAMATHAGVKSLASHLHALDTRVSEISKRQAKAEAEVLRRITAQDETLKRLEVLCSRRTEPALIVSEISSNEE